MVLAPLNVVEGSLAARLPHIEEDVLACLHTRGRASVRQLTRQVPWPSPLVLMGIGSLLGRGLIQDQPRALEWVLLPAAAPGAR